MTLTYQYACTSTSADNNGQIRTQVVGLLHELAHTLGVVPPDAGKTAQSEANTATIVANCLPAILAALNLSTR